MEVDGAAAIGAMGEDDMPSCKCLDTVSDCFSVSCLAEHHGFRFIHRGTTIGAATASVL
jgi:hypothetical protein